ncbi:MAG: peptide chain release factor N(5)-glutamine methyltransferase [Ilumatobacteraceae bacterium]
MSDEVTWRELWASTTEVIGSRAEARWLCETACALDGDEFLAALDERATERMVSHLDRMVARYRSGEPLAYVMGHWTFRRVELMVDRRVLIPRPETELVAERALELARAADAPRRILDLGTGSGAIGLAMVSELPIEGTEVWLTDASPDAIDVARANTAGLGRAAANVRLAVGNWFEALPSELVEQFDVIVSNPPYIAEDDPDVQESVREWEPHEALFAGADGLTDIELIVHHAPRWLKPGGWLVVEFGHRQGDAVRAVASEAGFTDVRIEHDLAGRDRMLIARRPR